MANNNLDMLLRINAQVTGQANIDQINDALAQQRIAALNAANATLDLSTAEGQNARLANDAAIAAERNALALREQARAAAAAANAIPNQTAAQQAAAAAAQANANALQHQANAANASAQSLTQQAAAANANAPQIQRTAQANQQAAQATNALKTAIQGFLAAASVQEFVRINAAFEGMAFGLTQITGSSEQARVEMDYVSDVARKIGVDVESATEAFISLTAATKGTALEGNNTRAIFESVANAMAKLGKPSYETKLALQAVAQIAGKGTVSLEEMRQQLGERLPGAMQAAARGMGKTVAEFVKMVENGEVLAEDLLPRLAIEINKTYESGGTDELPLNVVLTNLMNTLKETMLALGETGSIDVFKTALEGVQTVVEAVAITLSGAWEAVELLGKGFGAAGALITDFFNGDIQGGIQRFKENLHEALDSAATDINHVADKVTKAGKQTELTQAQLATLVPTAEKLAKSLTDVGNKAESSGEKLAKAFGNINLATPQGLLDWIDAIGVFGAKTKDADAALSAWINKANAADLKSFSQNLAGAYQAGLIEADRFNTFNADVLSATFEQLGLDVDASLGRISPAVNNGLVALQNLGQQLEKTLDAPEAKMRALEAATAGLIEKAKSSTDVAALAANIDAMGKAGKLSAEAVKRLTDELQAQKIKIEQLTPGVLALDEAFKAFGLTTSEALGRLSPAINEGIVALHTLVEELDRTVDSPIAKMQALEAAVKSLIDKAKTSTDIEALTANIDSMGKAGELSADGLKRLQDQLRSQRVEIEKTIPGMQSLLEMYDKFGIVSQEALNKAAKEAKELYEATAKAGKPAFELNQAYEKFAEATLKAAAAQGDWQKAQAITMLEGMAKTDENRAALNKLTGAHQEVASAAAQSGQVATQAAQVATQAVERQIKSVEDLEQAYIDAGDSAQEAQRKAYVEGNLRGLPSKGGAGGSPTTVVNNYNNGATGAPSSVGSSFEAFAIKAGIAAEDIAKYAGELKEAFDKVNTPGAVTLANQTGRSLDPVFQQALKDALIGAQANENAAKLQADRAQIEADSAQSQAERAQSAGITPPQAASAALSAEGIAGAVARALKNNPQIDTRAITEAIRAGQSGQPNISVYLDSKQIASQVQIAINDNIRRGLN